MTFKITLNGMGGELDSKIVQKEEDIKQAALDLIGECECLSGGDTITVQEIDD